MKQCVTVLASLLLLTGCDISINTNAPDTSTSTVTLSEPGTAQQQRHIVDKALEFLLLLDAGRIDLTWPESGSALKASTTESNWVKGLSGLRMGLGELKQRERALISFTKQLPNAPAGHYAAVQIQSTFANMTVTEAVLLGEEDEQWRVVGYNVSKTVEVATKFSLF